MVPDYEACRVKRKMVLAACMSGVVGWRKIKLHGSHKIQVSN